MGAEFCNLRALNWDIQNPLAPEPLKEHRIQQPYKVGRNMEGLISNRPEVVALRECLEAHEDNSNLQYLTNDEASI
jgi:hypothetical protein